MNQMEFPRFCAVVLYACRDERDPFFPAFTLRVRQPAAKIGLLRFRTDFARENPLNPERGHEGFRRVIARGGTREDTGEAIEPVPNPEPRQAPTR